MYMEYVPCIGNSSYSFWRILLKLYMCFKDGLKICILFSQDPLPRKRWLRPDMTEKLLTGTLSLNTTNQPNLRILKLFFLHFNLDIFSSLYATDMYKEYMPCIGNPAYSFRPILLKLYRYFAAFL